MNDEELRLEALKVASKIWDKTEAKYITDLAQVLFQYIKDGYIPHEQEETSE